jgi:hypothetical protein
MKLQHQLKKIIGLQNKKYYATWTMIKQNSSNPVSMVPDWLSDYLIVQIIRQHQYWLKIPAANLLLLPSKNMHLSGIFISSCKELDFSIITDPVTGFTAERITANHLHNTLSNCTNLDSFYICHLKGPFAFSLDAIKITTVPSFSLYHRKLTIQYHRKP